MHPRNHNLVGKEIDIHFYFLNRGIIITVMVHTLWTIMNSSYYYEYRENIHLSIKSTPAVLDCVKFSTEK